MDKKLVNKFKKIVRFKEDNEIFYKFDKIFKISKVKIIDYKFLWNIKDGKEYTVKHKYSFNYLNPITWIVIPLGFLIKCLMVIISGFIVGLKDISENLRNIFNTNFSSSNVRTSNVKIKDDIKKEDY